MNLDSQAGQRLRTWHQYAYRLLTPDKVHGQVQVPINSAEVSPTIKTDLCTLYLYACPKVTKYQVWFCLISGPCFLHLYLLHQHFSSQLKRFVLYINFSFRYLNVESFMYKRQQLDVSRGEG